MSKIFISYRRGDNPDGVARIYERLKKLLPTWEIFYDHHSIDLGTEFPDKIKQAVTDAEFVLVVIGAKWLELLKQRKESGELDYVHEEIRTAFETKSGVIPVAVENAAFLTESDLSEFPDIKGLANLNGQKVRPEPDFDKDMEALVGYLESRGPGVIVGSVLPGNYKLTREVGCGGMGIVYEAMQTNPNRRVAIKLIKAGQDTREVLARFDSERQALAMMEHENIAQVFDVGKSFSHRPFFVMEFVNGVPITEYCNEEKLSVRDRLELFRKVCAAVQHAHQKGVLHRDVTPNNVLVTEKDGEPIPKVIDFGLAKALGGKLSHHSFMTQLQTAVGTLGYSSPEQAAGKDVDTTTDIYSLGALLYEMLVGAPPFDVEELKSAGEDAMRRHIIDREPVKPSTKFSSSGAGTVNISQQRQIDPTKLQKILKGELDWVIMKALEKDRNRRYGTANDFASDVERYLNNEAVTACPPSTSYLVSKFVSKNRGLVASIAAVGLLLTAGIVGTSYGLLKASENAQDARLERDRAETARSFAILNEIKAKKETKRAIKAEKAANQSAERSEEILKVLTESFKMTDPSQGADGQTSARDILLQAKASLNSTNLDDQGKAELLVALSQACLGVGEYDHAITAARSAETIYQELFGPSHLSTMDSMKILADAYQAAGQIDEARKHFKLVLEQRETHLGVEHVDTLFSVLDLVGSHMVFLEYDKALLLLGDAAPKLSKLREKLGVDHPKMVTASLEYASALAKANGFSPESLRQAEIVTRNAIAAYTAKLGEDHPLTLEAVKDLASIYNSTGRINDALVLTRELFEARKLKLGEKHPVTLNTMCDLAIALSSSGKNQDALALALKSKDISDSELGGRHPSTIIAKQTLATIHSVNGNLTQATILAGEVFESKKISLGDDHPNTLLAMRNLIKIYQRTGKNEMALVLAAELIELARSRFGVDHDFTLAAMSDWLELLVERNSKVLPPKAVMIAETVLTEKAKKYGRSHPSTQYAMIRLSEFYLHIGKANEAGLLLEEVDKEKLLPKEALEDVQKGLRLAYIATENTTKLQSLLAKRIAKARTLVDNKLLSNILGQSGFDLFNAELHAEAEEILREYHALLLSDDFPRWMSFNAEAVVGATVLKQGRLDEAKKLLTNGYRGLKLHASNIPKESRLKRLSRAVNWLIELAESRQEKESLVEWTAEKEWMKKEHGFTKGATPNAKATDLGKEKDKNDE